MKFELEADEFMALPVVFAILVVCATLVFCVHSCNLNEEKEKPSKIEALNGK